MKILESYVTNGLHIIAVIIAVTDVKVICLKPTLMQDKIKFDKSGRASSKTRPVALHHTINTTHNFEQGGQTL